MIQIASWLPTAAALLLLLSLLGYVRLHRGHEPARRWARFAFYGAAGLLQVAAAVLLNGILTHRFDVEYIFGHSSTDLPYLYLISTFWAGQEGTFLLWSLYACFIGFAFIARSREWEGTIMAVWCAMVLLTVGMVLVKSPFAALDLNRFGPGDLDILRNQFGGVPPEGQGLNPLLQNPWMVIHPPILFLGFALMGAPFGLALAGLIRRDADGWAHRAQGWALLGFAVLGTGLILGGYWAYETLGWGGYWAWDPVENSSLVPWLYSGALFHGLLLQRGSGGAQRRLNYVLAALAFVSVTYGSYLNRSGVLADFSVHSFVALSAGFNRALMAFAFVPALVFLALFVIGRPADSPAKQAESLSRQNLLHWVTLLLMGSATVVLIGNSWPLVTHLLSLTPVVNQWVPAASSLQPPFYNILHTPYAMVLVSMLSLALLTGWHSAKRADLLAGLRLPLKIAGVAALLCGGGIYLYLRNRAETPDLMPGTAGRLALAWGTLIVLCTLAAAVNLRVLVEEFRRGERWSLGTHIAHAGFSILVIGLVVSSVYESKTMLELPRDSARPFFGYQLTYAGLIPEGRNARVRLIARRGSSERLLSPILRPTPDGVIWNPGIDKTLSHDLYIEPGEIRPRQGAEAVPLELDQPLSYGGLTIAFRRFDLGDHHAGLDPSNFSVGVELTVTRGGEETVVTPRFTISGGEIGNEPADLPGGGRIRVTEIPERQDGSGQRFLLLAFEGAQFGSTAETAVVQATIKPGMSVVWLGCWMICGGAFLAAARRAREAARRGRRREQPVERPAAAERVRRAGRGSARLPRGGD